MIFEIGILVMLVISSIEDIRRKEILLWEIIACAGLSLIRVAVGVYNGSFDGYGLLLSLLPGAMMLFLTIVTRQGIGLGDGLLILAYGPGLGAYKLWIGVMIAFFVCSFFSGALLVLKRAGKKTTIPFVPFLALGNAATFLLWSRG